MRRTVLVLALVLLAVPAASAAARGPDLRCADAHGSRYVLKFRPGACTRFGPGGSFARGVNLAGLHWRGWGRATAHAGGIEKGFHLPAEHIGVRVTAFRLRRCGHGPRVYTRLRSSSRFGSLLVRMSPCPGRA